MQRRKIRLKKNITDNGTRKKPLKETCSYLTGLLSFIRGIYVVETQSREGTSPGKCELPYAEGRKHQFSKLCLFALPYHLNGNWSVSVVEIILLVARVFAFKGEKWER